MSLSHRMAWFQAFRNSYGFTSYNDNRTHVTYDLPVVIVAYVCILVSIATLIATLGIRGTEKWAATIRACYAVAIGSIILACLVGHGWQTGGAYIKSPYVYRNNIPFEGYVGINVALHGANVTLDGYYGGVTERGYVSYSESIPWSDYGDQEIEYTYFLRRGLPDPILKIMGYMTIDEGSLRWGRSFHKAGYFAMVLLWTALSFWIISNVLLCSVIVYGAYTFTLTGVSMILACVAYHVCQCPLQLAIKFGDSVLTMEYAWCFWLTLVAGCLTCIIGLILIIADHFAHEGVSEFFHLEKLTDDDNSELDDRREHFHTLWKERRDLRTSSSSDFNGSIFLESCRKPDQRRELRNIRFHNGEPVLLVKPLDGKLRDFSKVNPLYVETQQVKEVNSNGHIRNITMLECVQEEDEATQFHSIPGSTLPRETFQQCADGEVPSSTSESFREENRRQNSKRVRVNEEVYTIEVPHTDLPACASDNLGHRCSERKGCLKSNCTMTVLSHDNGRRNSREILVTMEPFLCQASLDDVAEFSQPDSGCSRENSESDKSESASVEDSRSLESYSSENSDVIVNLNCS